LFPESEYTFKHALTHEVAYNSMLVERRRVVHARIVAAIEQLYPGRLPEQVERLAHHAVRGEVWDKAVDYSEQAGHKAAARWAHPEAVAYFDRALQAQKGLAASHQSHEQAIDLHLAARASLLALGEHDRIRDDLRDAEALAVAIDDRHRLAQVACDLANWYWIAGEHHRAIDASQRALALGASLDDFGLAVRTNHYLGHANYSLGKYPQAIAFYRRNVENLTGDLARECFEPGTVAAAASRGFLTLCLAECGEFAEGMATLVQAFEIAEGVDHAYALLTACWAVGHLNLRQGKLEAAMAALERGLRVGQERQIFLQVPRVTSTLGMAYALSGRLAEALPLLERGGSNVLRRGRSTTMGWTSPGWARAISWSAARQRPVTRLHRRCS
jgi:tetratricopeptide (TPR) repeat protein